MSSLLYLHAFTAGAALTNRKKLRPLSPMGLGLVVLEAWAPRFKKAKGTGWFELLTQAEGSFVLEPARVQALAKDLAIIAALETPKLAGKPRDAAEYVEAFQEELLGPVAAAAKAKAGLLGEWG